jgi:hypothetical protein
VPKRHWRHWQVEQRQLVRLYVLMPSLGVLVLLCLEQPHSSLWKPLASRLRPQQHPQHQQRHRHRAIAWSLR